MSRRLLLAAVVALALGASPAPAAARRLRRDPDRAGAALRAGRRVLERASRAGGAAHSRVAGLERAQPARLLVDPALRPRLRGAAAGRPPGDQGRRPRRAGGP